MYKLQKQLESIHRKSYPAYKSLKGVYDFKNYTLSIDHVQGDPFAFICCGVRGFHKPAGFPGNIFDRYDKTNCITGLLLRIFRKENFIVCFLGKRLWKKRSYFHEPLRAENFRENCLRIYR